ncbi:MAG: hypothetical protein IKQ36_00585 [Clostridia bacterium]|nr:hypothetical protein [Clostridia bacterium]
MKTESKFLRYGIPVIVLLIGAGFMIYGATDGEAFAVLKKAVAICMECIGLG